MKKIASKNFSLHLNKKTLVAYTIIAIFLGSFSGAAMYGFSKLFSQDPISIRFDSNRILKKFISKEELINFLETKPENNYYWGFPAIRDLKNIASLAMDEAAEGGQSVPDYSGTNIQVEGVDEADVVKTDGTYLYLLNGEKIFIIKAYPPTEAGIISVLDLEYPATDIFINGDKLVVIHSPNQYNIWYQWDYGPTLDYKMNTTIKVFDLSDKKSPKLERTAEVDGFYTSSRMINNYVYIISTQPAVFNDTEPILPRFSSNEYIYEANPKDIWYSNRTNYYHSYTNVVAINVQNPREWITHETYLLSSSSNIYVSQEHIYLTSPWWLQDKEGGSEATMIYKIRVKKGDIEYIADGSVPGRVLNQFSMDEHNDYFRIATTLGYVSRSGSKTSNNVYVLNSSLGITGSLEGLAPGEDIYSARFMGKRCYLVTFKKVDPLFVIDLSDPNNPEVLGKLKIPGYSDYLHPFDENTLIGIGKETIEAKEGDFAWYQGVKISLFDVSNVIKPIEIAKYEIGDRGTDSLALRNHKAFLFSKSKNLLVIPILLAEIDNEKYLEEVPPNAYGEYVYQGAFVFEISKERGINLRGNITHIEDPQEFLKSGYWFESFYSVERSLYIENELYTISKGMIKINNLEDLSEIKKIELK
jgi:uncharacterized secreted protein with C-terminal beta-propeller domain